MEPSSDQSRQAQSITTFNVSSQAQLNDLLGGLLLNLSGNLTGSLLNATGELPTLGLSSNVLAALANPAYTNVGAWGAPTSSYTPPPPPPPWWAEAAAGVMNSVSGVLHTVEGLVSVLWNAAVAAEAYLAKVAQAEANALGITALANQLGNTLRAVASAMLQALKALLEYIESAARAFLAAVLAPIVSSFRQALSSEAQSILKYGADLNTFATTDPIVDLGVVVGDLFAAIVAVVIAAEIIKIGTVVALKVIENLVPAAGPTVSTILVPLLLTLFVSGLSLLASGSGSHSGFAGIISGTEVLAGSVLTSIGETLFNSTEALAGLPLSAGDLSAFSNGDDLFGAGMVAGFGAGLLVGGAVSSLLPFKALDLAVDGDLIALAEAVLYYGGFLDPGNCATSDEQAVAISLFGMSGASVAFDIEGLAGSLVDLFSSRASSSPGVQAQKDLIALGIILSLVGLGIDGYETYAIAHQCGLV